MLVGEDGPHRRALAALLVAWLFLQGDRVLVSRLLAQFRCYARAFPTAVALKRFERPSCERSDAVKSGTGKVGVSSVSPEFRNESGTFPLGLDRVDAIRLKAAGLLATDHHPSTAGQRTH